MLLKNRAFFVDDITVPGSYFAATIRSPIAKGRLRGVEFPSTPFYTLITAKDIPGTNQLEDFPVPVLASDELSYIGEPVAILVGPHEARLREYAEQCKVIAEEEPPVFATGGNVFAERTLSIDESTPEPAASEDPPNVIAGAYKTGIQEHWYADPHGATAVFAEGRLTVYAAGQWLFHIKRSAAKVLGIPLESALVEPARIGMHLDGKIWYPSLIACHAALGAFITKKPVKLILTKQEDFRYSPKRNATAIEIRSTLRNTGDIAETDIRITADLGAQDVFTDETLDRTCLGCLGAYSLGRVRLSAAAVSTNIPPQGPLSGFGLSQGFFALERQVSRIADALGQDPAEWRKKHIRKGSLPIGVPLEEPPLEELIDAAAAMSGYYRKWSAYQLLRNKRHSSEWKVKDEPIRGVGIAAAYQGSGFLYDGSDRGVYGVEATFQADGVLEIATSVTSSNYTYIRTWREMAAEILSIEGELIRIRLGNTDTAPDSGPGSNSRNVAAIAGLVESACKAIQKRRLAEPLPITVRQSFSPALQIPWEGSSPPIGRLFNGQSLTHLGWACAVAEVEIDPEDHTPRIRGIWLSVDGGRILSEDRARLTLRQATIHALGWASREHLYYTNGKIPDMLFYNYDIPTAEDIPPIQVNFIRTDGAAPKGIGELPFSTVPAAYIQAVSQAMDYPFESIPLKTRAVWETGKLKKSEVPV
jgi:CO/xanthine dehydrogenase Mo-binding subunit